MVLAETSAVFCVVQVTNAADINLQITKINLCRMRQVAWLLINAFS